MNFSLFGYGIVVRNPINLIGQADTYYPGYTIVLEWPVEIWKEFPKPSNDEPLPPDYDDIPF